MHIHPISPTDRIVILRTHGSATAMYQQIGKKDWETVVQKSFDPDKKINIVEAIKEEFEKSRL